MALPIIKSLHPVVARALLGCSAAGVLLAITRAEWRGLPEVLASRGLVVDERSVHWIDPAGWGISTRRALVLAHGQGQLNDVYVVTARTGPSDRVISVRDISNLTNSRDASEESLIVNGTHAVFNTRVGEQLFALNILDTHGDFASHGSRASFGLRLRRAITQYQHTGRFSGYGISRYNLVHPRPTLRVEISDRGVVTHTPDGDIRIDPVHQRVLEGQSLVRARPRSVSENDDWVTWTVNTVRGISWIGPQPIAWLESFAFQAKHEMEVRTAGAVTVQAQEARVREDLADVLAGANSTGNNEVLEGTVTAWPPERLRTRLSESIQLEGEWASVSHGDNDPFMPTNAGAPSPMYLTFVRVDPQRPDAPAYIALWDPRQIEIHVAPGAEDPMGATGELGTGAIPRDRAVLGRLVGAFNGAFQALHGEFGVAGEGMVLLPPKPYGATVALFADGNTGFGSWPMGQDNIPENIVELRQNLTPIVDQGQFNPWGRNSWGLIFRGPGGTNDPTHTARSGICMTQEGYIAYIWGSSLSPNTLGEAMLAARCSYGIHLDMNGSNLGMELYRTGSSSPGDLRELPDVGRPLVNRYETEGEVPDVRGMQFRARRLVRSMGGPFPRYIRREGRDFFYLLLRPVLPGPAIVSRVQPARPGEGQWHVSGLSTLPFPWPMARTRIRPSEADPNLAVNLVRIDARRVALAPADAQQSVVARFVNAPLATDRQMRISMTEGSAGARWIIGNAGDGIVVEPMMRGASVLRGACIDNNGYLVIAVAERAVSDLVYRALEAANCGTQRVTLSGAVLALPSGQTAAGDVAPTGATATLSLIAREFPTGRRLFPEVTPVSARVWEPIQRRQVRYHSTGTGLIEVHLAGQAPVILPQRGPRRFRTPQPAPPQ